jgi:hypothetical protein
MPIGKYFGGKGDKVMNEMKERYGDKKGKSVFYATSNKMKKKGKKRMTAHAQAAALKEGGKL